MAESIRPRSLKGPLVRRNRVRELTKTSRHAGYVNLPPVRTPGGARSERVVKEGSGMDTNAVPCAQPCVRCTAERKPVRRWFPAGRSIFLLLDERSIEIPGRDAVPSEPS